MIITENMLFENIKHRTKIKV